ncbi:MAG: hypothetical protein ABI785_08900 [Gemmatimonadales bacterium]
MRPLPLIFLLLALGAAACSDSNGLADASVANVERTDTLWALVGTPVSTPSGYSVEGSRRVRTDLSVNFDFAYNVETQGEHVFLPRAALGIDTANAAKPGFQIRNEGFEAITLAPSNGYITDVPVPITVGQRYVVRSRVTCQIGVPKYAKMEILSFDELTRIVSFRILTNDNCGFKSLEPGLPNR